MSLNKNSFLSKLIKGNGYEARHADIKGANNDTKIYIAIYAGRHTTPDQAFVLRSYTIYELRNQNISVG